MNFKRDDFSHVRWSLLLAIVLIGTGLVLVLLSQDGVKNATRELASASANKNEYDGKLRQVRTEEAEIRSKAALYSNLSARGIIGEEQRLDWVEEVREIREKRKLLDLQYEFAPQQSLDKTTVAGYNFYTSTMRVRMKLLHEGDLLNFINDLREKAKAYIRVRSCNVTRIERNANTNDFATLNAECQIDWITIGQAKGKP